MQLSLTTDDGVPHLSLSGIPEACHNVRLRLNGVLCYQHHQPGPLLRVPLTEIVDPLGSLPVGTVAVSGVALDAHSQPLALLHASLEVPPAVAAHQQRSGGDNNGRPSNEAPARRLLAAALQLPGEQHTWRLRPFCQSVNSGQSQLLRLTLEQPSAGARLQVQWLLLRPPPTRQEEAAGGGGATQTEEPPPAKRSCLEGGERSEEVAFESSVSIRGDSGSDSTLCCRPGVVDTVECHVSRLSGCMHPGPLRYAIHVQPMIVATTIPQMMMMPAPPSAASSPTTSVEQQRPPRRRAVLVGVSKYRRRPRGDLEWCDEDASTWYDWLRQRGFECRIFGDEFSPYPRWDGPATVQNVRRAVRDMVAEANQPGDRIVFVDSSHGNGDGLGASYLCLLPDDVPGASPDERQGKYWDRDLAADLAGPGGVNAAFTFVFLDACFSGGILQELVYSLPHSFGTSTCTQKGYGYDESASAHGAWTEAFLVEGLQRHPGPAEDLVGLFETCRQGYIQRHASRGDRPCCFLSLGPRKFNTNDEADVPLPRGALRLQDVF